ncbi:MAG: ribbon-helix-helix protein, CopG family [Spirochaetales bacterium]
MKTITIHVPEATYSSFQEFAQRTGTTASELIRAAMHEYYEANIRRAGSIFDSEPARVGRVVHPLSAEDDLLEEMLP